MSIVPLFLLGCGSDCSPPTEIASFGLTGDVPSTFPVGVQLSSTSSQLQQVKINSTNSVFELSTVGSDTGWILVYPKEPWSATTNQVDIKVCDAEFEKSFATRSDSSMSSFVGYFADIATANHRSATTGMTIWVEFDADSERLTLGISEQERCAVLLGSCDASIRDGVVSTGSCMWEFLGFATEGSARVSIADNGRGHLLVEGWSQGPEVDAICVSLGPDQAPCEYSDETWELAETVLSEQFSSGSEIPWCPSR